MAIIPSPQADIDREVNVHIQALLKENRTIQTSWIVQDLILKHQAIRGADAPWYNRCGYEHLRNCVQKAIRSYQIGPEGHWEQYQLEGFIEDGYKQLQKAYVTQRDKTSQIIPIGQMTKKELLAKAAELRTMGDGCYAHAEEIERYIKIRFSQAA